jgi:hypothetical protein
LKFVTCHNLWTAGDIRILFLIKLVFINETLLDAASLYRGCNLFPYPDNSAGLESKSVKQLRLVRLTIDYGYLKVRVVGKSINYVAIVIFFDLKLKAFCGGGFFIFVTEAMEPDDFEFSPNLWFASVDPGFEFFLPNIHGIRRRQNQSRILVVWGKSSLIDDAGLIIKTGKGVRFARARRISRMIFR